MKEEREEEKGKKEVKRGIRKEVRVENKNTKELERKVWKGASEV